MSLILLVAQYVDRIVKNVWIDFIKFLTLHNLFY